MQQRSSWNPPQHRVNLFVLLLALAHAILALLFSLGPIFEGPDEIEHYRYIRYVATHGVLPPPNGQSYGQYHQAPLYYMLLAPISAQLRDTRPARLTAYRNPYTGYQFDLPGNDNKNVYLHESDEMFPYPDRTARAVHLLRLTSPLFGVATVLMGFAVFRLLWPQCVEMQLVGVSIVALWPSLIYMSSVLNNDSLAISLSSAALYLVLRQQRDGATLRSSLLLGLVLGAALLSKAHATLLVVPVGLAVLTDRRIWKYAIITLFVTLLVAGWWYLRNLVLVGDPIGIAANRQTWPFDRLETDEFWLTAGLKRLNIAYDRLWARFGHGAVAVAGWMYRLFDFAILLSFFAFITSLFRRHETTRLQRLQALVILAWFAGYATALVYFSGTAVNGNQGRYLLPAIVPIAVFLTLGVHFLLQKLPPPRKYDPVLVSGGLLVMVLLILLCYFFPAYRPITVPMTPPRELDVRFGDFADLIGMSPEPLTARPGDSITIELYWRAKGQGPTGLQSFLHAVDGEQFLWRDSIPGNGNFPAMNWRAGDTWGERYLVYIPETVNAGDRFLVTAGLYDRTAGVPVEGFAADGTSLSLSPVIATLWITP
ncbi:MAG: DUF2142 domain-containing protein [Chloroflexi bacterium]|nr:DUF2142 domain-containing protein [Chloroflexota bacterium]